MMGEIAAYRYAMRVRLHTAPHSARRGIERRQSELKTLEKATKKEKAVLNREDLEVAQKKQDYMNVMMRIDNLAQLIQTKLGENSQAVETLYIVISGIKSCAQVGITTYFQKEG